MLNDIVNSAMQKGANLLAANDPAGAISTLKPLVALIPNEPDLHFLLGIAHVHTAKYTDAIEHFDLALFASPQNPFIYLHKGIALRRKGDPISAIGSFDLALKYTPRLAEAFVQKGNALLDLSLYSDAIEIYEHAISIEITHAEALYNLSLSHVKQGNYDKAISTLEKLVLITPNDFEVHFKLANLYKQSHKHGLALSSYEEAARINPHDPQLFYQVGEFYLDIKQPLKAIDAFEIAKRIDSTFDGLCGALHFAKMMVCDWYAYAETLSTIRSLIKEHKLAAHPFALLCLPLSSEEHKAAAQTYCRNNLAITPNPFSTYKNCSTKIRIAYISADYHSHATSHLMAEVFEIHDRSKFDVIGICYGASPEDSMRRRIRESFDQFIEVGLESDESIAKQIHELGIDIAIDLKGHTQDARLGIFAYHPAPIQVHYLGYPGTTGSEHIQYLIGDITTIPTQAQSFYTESIVYLPDTYQANDRNRRIANNAHSRSDHGLPEEGFVFCCFNNNWKITPDVFDIWMNVLIQVENSVLWLFKDNDQAATNLLAEAEKRGVRGYRLVFATRIPLDQHLSRHRHADLFLDTFYYNAHTTASDALWAELPVLTKLGETFSSRVCASLLNALGISELITNSNQEYERLAIELATHPTALQAIKKKIQANRLSAPLFDTSRFTINLENAYEQMINKLRNVSSL